MDIKNLLLLPDLVAIACMALVLIRLRGKRAPDGLHLWIIGMLLIVAECVTRLLYSMALPKSVHSAMHVLSLETYLLAGVAFFQSATGRLRYLKHSDPYLGVCVAPHTILLFAYGANMGTRADYMLIAGVGLVAGIVVATTLRRPTVHMFCHAAIWLPILVAADMGLFRTCAYLSLFFAYGGTALAFWLTMPQRRRGRAAVVGAFAVWSLCFLSHPWIAERHHEWVGFAEQIWDLQKFFITFGLLIAALDEQMTTNEHHALHDVLTGLPNRRFFEDRIEVALGSARANTRLLLFNMDMNEFKQVNDELGHEAGDQLLRQVARRLQTAVRSVDTLARMGGDEFNLLISDSPEAPREIPVKAYGERAERIAADLRNALTMAQFEVDVDGEPQRVKTSISIGWAIFPDEATNTLELAAIADKRMYADKRASSPTHRELAAGATREAWERGGERGPTLVADRTHSMESKSRLAAAAG